MSAIAYRKEPLGCQFDGSYAITLLTLKQQCIRQTDSREVLFDSIYMLQFVLFFAIFNESL
jgi:hypothetical protein